MDISAAIKTSTSDGSGVFFHAFSENLVPPTIYDSNQTRMIDINDYTVAGILWNFFRADRRGTILESRYPNTRGIPEANEVEIFDPQPVMGLAIGSFTNPSHSDTISMACFTETSLRGCLLNGFESNSQGSEADLALLDAIRNTPIDQLGNVLSDMLNAMAGGASETTITILKNPKLTITRLAPSDFDTVTNNWIGALETPFFDAFDLIKERVTRQESSLNSAGYASAVYTDNGGDGSNDTIVFTAEYGMTEKYISLI